MSLAPFMLAGLLAGLGLWLIVYGLIPTQPRLGDALERLSPGQIAFYAPLTRETAVVTPPTFAERLGTRINRVIGHLPGMSAPEEDLALLAGIGDKDAPTRGALYATKATYAAAGLLITSVLALALQLAGLDIMIVIPAVFALFFAVTGWMLPDESIKRRAKEARAEFRRVAVAYLRLIAIRRTASGGAVDSMFGAAELADTWPFVRIRAELYRAQWARIPPWDALADLGESIGVTELAEIGDIMRMAGESDAAVADSLLARASSQREQMLADAQADAGAATTSMDVPRGLLVVLGILVVLYPVALALVGAQAGGG